MQVEINSVWRFAGVDGFDDGLYRVLACYPDYAMAVLFQIVEGSKLQRPAAVDLPFFLRQAEEGAISPEKYPNPHYQQSDDRNVPSAHLQKRDIRIKQIKDLISDPWFLLKLVTDLRSKVVAEHAKKQGVYVQALYRSLNLYWKYGQEYNALLPAYTNSGGAGRTRVAGKVKRGAPIRLSTPSLAAPPSVNTSEKDKTIFLKAMKRFGMKGKKVTFRKVYDQMLTEFYAKELIAADLEGRVALVPQYRAFLYWIKRLIPQQELIRKQTSPGDFDRNRRGLRGAATDHTAVLGSCFELDATVLDVHVVSEFRRNHVLGRPTVYCVVDKESRMIVGIHVSLEYASWRAGRQALVNAFTSKKEYCARYGIEIEDSEWPCHHIPQRLLCDRGEFICQDAENLAVPLIGHLSIAPPYRAELKGIVEHRFNILNEKLIHDLMGTTRGRHYIRGDKDPRMEAVLTLDEVNTLLIDAVLEHNSQVFESLAGQCSLLIEEELAPTPINYWNIHLQKHRHALSTLDEATIRARLLPADWVSMTSKGVRLNDDMYYASDHPNFEDWKVIARSGGSWRLEARIDQDNSSFIYVRFKPDEGFSPCWLRKASKSFDERHHADILFFEDWKKLEKHRAKPTAKSVERHQRRKEITQNAQTESAKAPPLKSKAEKIRGMKERRRQSVLEARVTAEPADDMCHAPEMPELDKLNDERRKNVVSLLKRKKGESE